MSNNLGVRRPSYFRSPSDTVVLMNSVEERRQSVPALASLTHLDYRRHSTPLNQDPGVPDARRDSLPMFYATLANSRRESLALPPPSPTPSDSASLAGGPLDTTPTASNVANYGRRQPTLAAQQGYQPVYNPPPPSPPLWQTVAQGTWGRVRRQGRDAVMMAGLVTLALWNALLTVRVFRYAPPTIYNDRQLEDALIALDRNTPWRNEL